MLADCWGRILLVIASRWQRHCEHAKVLMVCRMQTMIIALSWIISQNLIVLSGRHVGLRGVHIGVAKSLAHMRLTSE